MWYTKNFIKIAQSKLTRSQLTVDEVAKEEFEKLFPNNKGFITANEGTYSIILSNGEAVSGTLEELRTIAAGAGTSAGTAPAGTAPAGTAPAGAAPAGAAPAGAGTPAGTAPGGDNKIKNRKFELLYPKRSDGKFLFKFRDEYVEDYNKLVDANFKMIITGIPDNSDVGYKLEIEHGQIPSGVDPKFIDHLKKYIIDEAVFQIATDGNGAPKISKYELTFENKTTITPAKFEKTFVIPELINARIGDPIKLKIDGRDIKNVKNGEKVILDPNDLFLTEGKHIIEFVSNNADRNLNPTKSDFLTYQINVIDGQKLSLIGSAKGSFPHLYNRAPLSTDIQRIEEYLKSRSQPIKFAPVDENKIDNLREALRTEATNHGLQTKVYNTVMQNYNYNEVEQYIDEIMKNQNNYLTFNLRKKYADSLKKERGKVKSQNTVDAIINPR